MHIDFTTIIDYIGTFAFAISGIRLASAKRFDWFGAYVVGAATAIGGGTTRDLLLGVTPFWMHQPSYLIVTGLALLFVIMFGKHVIRLNNTFFIFDAIGHSRHFHQRGTPYLPQGYLRHRLYSRRLYLLRL